MIRARLTLLAVLALAGPALAAGPVATMTIETQRKLGVSVQALPSARHAGAPTGFARVLDPVPLATLDADITAAAAAARASQAEAARARSLAAADATVSARAAEAATAQARADAAKVTLLRRRLGLEWGPTFMAMSDARRAGLIDGLASGRAALVRIDAASGLTGVRAATLDLGQGAKAGVQILGPARTSDPRLLSNGLIGLVSGAGARHLGIGLTTPVTLSTGGAAEGVLIPRAAVVRTGGASFAYVRLDATHFERRMIGGAAPEPGGLFAASGFRPGERVVVAGAAALLTAETAAPAKED